MALRSVTRKVTALYDEALEPFGITIAQYGLLRRIDGAAATSLTDLGRAAGLDRSTVGRNVRLLETMGLVRLTSGEDQREAKVRLSEEGQARLAATLEPWRAVQRTLDERIGAETSAALRSLAVQL